MPFIFSERLPVPTVKSYCLLSGLIFAASLLYAKNIILEANENEEGKTNFYQSIQKIYLNDQFCLWSMVNIAYCGLFIVGKTIQHLVFGRLRLTEEQHLQDKFWNFVFYKLIFVFGVINAQSLHEVLCWSSWFSMLGFFHILGQMSKDRFEYVITSPVTSRNTHTKLIILISCVFFASFLLAGVAVYYGYPNGLNIFVFMMEECILLGLKSLLLLIKYAVQLGDISPTNRWDGKAKVVYYVNFTLEMFYYATDLIYHFHMLLWSNVFLSMASLVLYWNIRTMFSEIRKKIKKYKSFKKILASVDLRFPRATADELETFGDHCAICWEEMLEARRLPCSHLFHHSCLCSWLLQDVSCPTCRRTLSADIGLNHHAHNHGNNDNMENSEEVPNENPVSENENRGGYRNYFFYLDGQQIANWFPSFSIEVFHGRGEDREQEVNDMGQQLFTMFPNVSQDAILADLRRTHSIEATADNILEGNLPSTPYEEAPPRIEEPSQDSIPNLDESSVATTNSDHPSDSEVYIDESSETDDHSMTQDTDSDTRVRDLDSRARVINRRHEKNTTRRRFLGMTGSSKNRNVNEASASRENQKSERDERRTLFLEAIERRSSKSHNT